MELIFWLMLGAVCFWILGRFAIFDYFTTEPIRITVLWFWIRSSFCGLVYAFLLWHKNEFLCFFFFQPLAVSTSCMVVLSLLSACFNLGQGTLNCWFCGSVYTLPVLAILNHAVISQILEAIIISSIYLCCDREKYDKLYKLMLNTRDWGAQS